MDLTPDPDPDGMVEKSAIKMAEQDPALQVLTSAGRVASPIAYSRARGLLREFWPLAYRAGQEFAARAAVELLQDGQRYMRWARDGHWSGTRPRASFGTGDVVWAAAPPPATPVRSPRRRARRGMARWFAGYLWGACGAHRPGTCATCTRLARGPTAILGPDLADSMRRALMRRAGRVRHPLAIDGAAYRRRRR